MCPSIIFIKMCWVCDKHWREEIFTEFGGKHERKILPGRPVPNRLAEITADLGCCDATHRQPTVQFPSHS
jgi:hypothetical protein